MLKHALWTAAMGAALLLAGCGGGGGDAPAASAPLSTANFDDTSRAITASVVGGGSAFGAVAGAFDVIGTAASVDASVSPLAPLGSGQVNAIARFALDRVAGRQTVKAKAAAVEAISESCPGGGTVSGSLNDADNNNVASGGDTLTLQVTSCVLDSGLPPVNGGLTIAVRSISYGANGDVDSGNLGLSFSNFSSDGVTLNGAATFSVSANTVTLVHDKLSASYVGRTLTFNHTVVVNTSSDTLNVSGSLSVNGSAYTLSTPTAIQIGNANPTAGTLRIADSSGGRIDVVMSGTGFVASLYLPGDAVADASATRPWTDL